MARVLAGVPVPMITYTTGAATRPSFDRDLFEVPLLSGVLWYQVDSTGHLRGLRWRIPTDSRELNALLAQAVVRAESLGLLPPAPRGSRSAMDGLVLHLQTNRNASALAFHVAAINLSYIPLDSPLAYRSYEGPRTYRMRDDAIPVPDTMVLELRIAPSGEVMLDSSRFVSASYREYRDLARTYVAAVRFHPATSGGCPVSVRTRVTLPLIIEH